MSSSTHFLNDLDRISRTRQAIAQNLEKIADALFTAEAEGETTSGKLGLEREIEDISTASKNLKKGVFRLLVLGDMKRGKSTFLNALIGENLLPSDVNPCTALLTILKYGAEKTVTIHFNDGKPPERIDFKDFKQRYTIPPEEAKELEQKKQQAFPDVSHAVVEYPLPLLEKGVEIVDSPGLNDTEARNALSLGYINNCHAILFVLRASQPCTMAERRYLENYIKDRGLSIFFLINAWDQVKEGLIDPDDAAELAEAENKLRKVFHANLAEYCVVDGVNVYDERVFEISAITALRRRIKDANADLEGTGFTPFIRSLNTFLTQERAIAELRQGRTLARQAQTRVKEAIDRRIPLLNQTVQELKQRIQSVEPQFAQLSEIRDQFRDEIRSMRDRKARAIADSFRTYVFGLEGTFEQDFLRYQPGDMQFFDFLSENKRQQFNAAAQQGFQQYVNDKFFAWTLTAEKDLTAAFGDLSKSAEKYGASYAQITDQISAKLTGQALHPRPETSTGDDNTPGWAKWAMGLFSLATGNFAGAALAVSGFDFKSILLNLFATTGIAIIFGSILGPFGIIIASLGLGALQADHARKQFAKAIKKELVKYLPKIAQEQWQPIYSAVQECFDAYEREVIKRINDDIHSRHAELNNLLKQKESHEINREMELKRLQGVEAIVSDECRKLEASYQTLLV
ncbi:dynamin family protein [Oscillatoria sp. FACHB-1407]|uniref:dynamin family protein n=1 Tax=Oscillatoria sp. FACHB-1407 TaxID=2692847 RepID=UPI001681C78D|nr:dynamin family protein [Oscillatoria sp. FACHB-1407]MBD2460504.1 dynamin family protein [Oscillatoria sp. FACHB-1407]